MMKVRVRRSVSGCPLYGVRVPQSPAPAAPRPVPHRPPELTAVRRDIQRRPSAPPAFDPEVPSPGVCQLFRRLHTTDLVCDPTDDPFRLSPHPRSVLLA